MTNHPAAKCLALLFCALFLAGCEKKVAEEIDFGTLSDNVYQNEYFGLKLKLPAEWSIQDEEKRQQILEKGATILAGSDKNFKAKLKASEQQTIYLLAAFQHPPGTAVPFNPSIMCMAERVRSLPGIRRGKDYLFHARKMMEAGQMKFEFPKEIYSAKLDGSEFDVMESTLKVGSSVVQQRYYATISKGYALCFVFSYKTPEEESVLKSILENVSLKGAP